MWMVNLKDLPGIILLKYCSKKCSALFEENSIVNQINLSKYKTEVLILRKRLPEKVSRLVVILLTSGTKFDLCFSYEGTNLGLKPCGLHLKLCQCFETTCF